MKIFRSILIFLSMYFLFSFPVFSLSFNDSGTPEELAAKIENAMTDEQALAQVFMFGWVGEEPSPLIMDWITRRGIGGVKIFGWNTSDTQKLARTVGELQQASLRGAFNIPLLVATDQEGGWVRHVRGSTSETPGNMAIGASGYPRDSYLSGYYIGKEMSLLGINMNFAPAIDLFTNRNSTLIGPRAFGDNPVRAGILGAAFARGQLDTGVIPTAKHFPGHGDTALDSHGVLPRINIPYETLWDRELLPYRMMIAEGVPVIMSGHLAFPLTEGGNTPASLSRFFLTEVLRKRMGFNGVVITDDLMMVGATVYLGSLSLTAKQALSAGNDILMFSSTPFLNDSIWTYLLNSMRTEPDFRRTVRASARRVLELKLRYLRGDKRVPYIPNLARVQREIPDPEGSAFFLNLASRSATIVKPNPPSSLFPLTPENAGRVLLTGRYRDFFNFGRRAYPDARTYLYNIQSDPDTILPYARNADTIIFCLADENDLPMLRNLQQLNKRVIVFSVLSPVHLENVSWVTGAIAVYSYAPESFAAGFSVITGRIPSQGILPYD
ncbi:MAG: glycoside hydrolase family 3 protein [Treponema sp.]|jgi:beta-N-acetylhexosaminidase|nr:glycoside hydrolase family 3 protein [Treponema sp.]